MRLVGSSCVVGGSAVDDGGGGVEVGAREVVRVDEDGDGDGDGVTVAIEELDGTAEEEAPVPTELIWLWRLWRGRCAFSSTAQTEETIRNAKRMTDAAIDEICILMPGRCV